MQSHATFSWATRAALTATLLAVGTMSVGCGGAKYDKSRPNGAEYSGAARSEMRTNTGAPRGDMDAEASNSTERYEHLAENKFVATATETKSTFAIDVDTASYTIMRRDLMQTNSLPNPDSVRIEEYLNYFDYDYAPPVLGEHPFAVHMAAAPSPFQAGHSLLRVALKGYEVPAASREPANLVFLIDVSGSMMDADKLPLVKYSLAQLLRQLSPDDTLGIVVYAGREAVLLEPTPVHKKSAILDAIDSLQAGGSTAGEAGIRRAYALAESVKRDKGTNRVILCTDGDFNVGARDDELVRLVESWRDKGIFLTCFLFGRGNINDAFVEKLSNKGNGNYAYIDSPNEALRALVDKVSGTLQVIAKDVKIQVEFNPATVEKFRLVGYENRVMANEDFRDDKVDAGELGAGHSVTAFYEIELKSDVPADANVAAVRLRYKGPQATSQTEAVEFGTSFLAGEIAASFADAPANFRFASAVIEFAQLLRRSQFSGAGTMAHVLDIATATTEGKPERDQFVKLVQKAQPLFKAAQPVGAPGN